MRSKIKFLALILAIMMILCACDTAIEQGSSTDTETETEAVTDASTEATTEETETETETEESTYRQSISRDREELEAMLTISDEIFTEAEAQLVQFEEMAISSTDVDAINEIYEAFEDTYDFVSTQVSVSSIIYYINMSDSDAYDRYIGLYEKYGDMYNSYMAHCKAVYEQSPVRDELFADWTEEEIKMLLNFSPETTALSIKNDELTDELNNLSFGKLQTRGAEIYAEIVTNNNKIAKLYGYDNYYEYASKEIYGRDFTMSQAADFCTTVAEVYAPKYTSLYKLHNIALSKATKDDRDFFNAFMNTRFDLLPENYLMNYFNSLEGSMKEGMLHAFVNRNMVFSDASNSHPSAFQTYLDDFEMPFCLFGSNGQSSSTIVHEIGHYYSSLHNASLFSYDLAEVQSQGNEMLLLDYMRDCMTPEAHEALKTYVMHSNMTTIIVSAMVDEFERAVYAQESVEGWGAKEFDAIMDEVCEKFGGKDFIKLNIGDMNSYWRQVATNNPVYYISYGVSMISAINIYAECENDRAAGREMYRAVVENVSDADTFLTALEKAGITSPFAAETTEKILLTLWGE